MRPMLLWTILCCALFEGDARCLALPDSNGPYAASLRISTISGTAIRGPFYQNLPCVHIEEAFPMFRVALRAFLFCLHGSHVGVSRRNRSYSICPCRASGRDFTTHWHHDITIAYHRPLVNDRKVWDALVPYGKVWRAGANENYERSPSAIRFRSKASRSTKNLRFAHDPERR